MAITNGDPNLPASVGVGTSGVINLPVVGAGSEITFGTGAASGIRSPRGGSFSGDPAAKREVRPGTSELFGKEVQLDGKSVLFRGAVISELQVELGSTGGTDALTECVLVQGDNFRFLARAADVYEV